MRQALGDVAADNASVVFDFTLIYGPECVILWTAGTLEKGDVRRRGGRQALGNSQGVKGPTILIQ